MVTGGGGFALGGGDIPSPWPGHLSPDQVTSSTTRSTSPSEVTSSQGQTTSPTPAFGQHHTRGTTVNVRVVRILLECNLVLLILLSMDNS